MIRRLVLIACVLAACVTVPLGAQTIDTIVVDNHNVFEPSGEPLPLLARLGNALHVRTRPWVVRRTLLFNQGDPYDSARMVESERGLRSLQVFREVRLDTTRVDGRLALRATTADGWSTRPQVGFSSAAGDVSWDAGLVEKNLLGTAMQVLVDFYRTPDRRQVTLFWEAPGVLFRRARLAASYSDLSDGAFGSWSYGVPFYETTAPWSLGTGGGAGTLRVLRFRDGALADSVQRRLLVVGVNGGVALAAGDRGYARLKFFAQLRRDNFRPYGVAAAPDSVSVAAGMGLELGRVRYEITEGLDQYARREDVDVSERLWIGVWAAPRAFGYGPGRAGVGPELQAQVGSAWPGGFAWLKLSADGVLSASGVDSGRVEGGVTVMSRRFARQTVVLHAEGGVARRPAPGTEFDTWFAQNGPRAFGAHAFTGTRRYWAVAEDRILVTPAFAGLFGVGLAPFAEWGGAWYADERPRAGGDVGLALRLGSTRSTRGEVTEISVANRFGAGFSGGRWVVTVREAVDFRQ